MIKRDYKKIAEQFKESLQTTLNYTQSLIISAVIENKAFNVDSALSCVEIGAILKKFGYNCSLDCIYSNLNYLTYTINALSVATKKEEKRPYIKVWYCAIEEEFTDESKNA